MKKILILISAATLVFSCKKDPSACFEYSPATELKTGDTVTFTNCSDNADSYLWEFADGTTSTEANPKHVFTATGSFSVTLTATNDKSSEKISKVLDLNIVSLNDTIVYSQDLHLSSGVIKSSNFDFDLDSDGVTDVTMSHEASAGSSAHLFYSKLEVFNNYYVQFDTVRITTFCTSKIDNSTFETTEKCLMPSLSRTRTDIESCSSLFTQSPVYLTYDEGYGSAGGPLTCNPTVVFDQLIDSENDLYVVIKKNTEEGVLTGWIQLRVINKGTIMLRSYKMMTKKEGLTL